MSPSPTGRGRSIAHRREARDMSQEDLARVCECSVRTIQRIERDECETISNRIADALHRYLGVPLRELVARGKEPAA